MPKILFLDVDGTLVDYRDRCPASAKEAVETARAAGHRAYLCTGRSRGEIDGRGLPDVDGLIGANGGYVEAGGEVLLHQAIPADRVADIVAWCETRGLGLYLEANSGMYCNHLMMEQGGEAFRAYARGKGSDEADVEAVVASVLGNFIERDAAALARADVNKISFVLSNHRDHLDSAAEFSDMEAHTWGGRDELALFGDLGPKGVSKKRAIELLLEHAGASPRDAIAFGDAAIDLPMFEACGFSVAMGNASEAVKAAADFVTDDVGADGLAKAFARLGLS